MPGRGDALHAYLTEALAPHLVALSMTTRLLPNPAPGGAPFLLAERIEAPDLPTVLSYGHGDVTRAQTDAWAEGLHPFRLTQRGDRFYGRGSADNKGQHLVNLTALRAHLDRHGFPMVEIVDSDELPFTATRLDPDHPWARFAIASVTETVGTAPHLLPNLGGSLPNECFSDILDLPTIWVPHSYAGCNQHAPDEHVLGSTMRQAAQVMTGLFWDVGATPPGK